MKKKYLLIISLATLSIAAFSQRTIEVAKTSKKIYADENNSRSQMDTIWGEYHSWTEAKCYVSSSGLVLGNNLYGDKQKVQVFLNNTPMKIEEAIVWFGVKGSWGASNPNSKVVVKTYNIDGTGRNASGPNKPAPKTSTSSVDLLLTDIDTTGSWNIVAFTNPVIVHNDFGIGVDFTTLDPSDRAGLMASHLGGGNDFGDLAWEQLADGSWQTIAVPQSDDGWGLDLQIAIFPIVNTEGVGLKTIKNEHFKIYQNMPNPFSSTSLVFYELAEAAEVSLEVFDMAGKSMMIINEGFKDAGKSMIKIDASHYPSGIYHYTMTIGGEKVTKKMVVLK